MSSQSEGIKVRHNPSSSGYRLIELPSEVEAALEGPGAPLRRWLYRPTHARQVLQHEPKQAVETIAMVHETVELEEVVNKEAVSRKLNTGSKGKWHEKFGKNR